MRSGDTGSFGANLAFVLGPMKTTKKGWPFAKASECSPATKQAEKTVTASLKLV